MVRRFVKTFRGVSVENRPAERGAFHGIAVATARDVAAREDELELAGAGLAEHSDRTAAETLLASVVFDLLHDSIRVLGTVQTDKYLANHRLLVLREKLGDFFVRDHPVVVDFRAERMVEGKTDRLLLLLAQAPVERRDERFRLGRFRRRLFGLRSGQGRQGAGGDGSGADHGGFEESSASDSSATLAIMGRKRLC